MNNHEFGILSITVRLQRLCDILRKDARTIYKKYDATFMNKWYPVLILLYEKSSVSLAELASELGYAHPSVIQMVNEMEEEKLIKSTNHKKDKRKRMVSLTPKGKKLRENILPFAIAMTQVLDKITKTENNIIKSLEEVEAQLQKESFYTRVNKILQKNNLNNTNISNNQK